MEELNKNNGNIVKKILFFEPFLTGHRLDHIRFIVEYAESETNIKLVLIVSPEFHDKIEMKKHVSVIRLSVAEHKKLMQGNIKQSFYQYLILRKYIRLTGIKIVYSDSLDKLYNLLAFKLPFPMGTELSGIIYRADFHYDKLYGKASATFMQQLNKLRKKLLLYWSYQNKFLKNVYSSDELFPEFTNRCFNTNKNRYIPDPALFEHKNIPKTCKFVDVATRPTILSFFGYIDRRKGIIQLLDALDKVKQEYQKKISIIIAGKISETIKSEVDEKIANLKKTNKIELLVENGYIALQDLTYLVANSSLILAPYLRHPGTSGVILWAAKAGKPVLTQKYGLLGYLTKKYKLGYSVDTNDPSQIANCINNFVENEGVNNNLFNSLRAVKYTDGNTPHAFAQAIFNSLDN